MEFWELVKMEIDKRMHRISHRKIYKWLIVPWLIWVKVVYWVLLAVNWSLTGVEIRIRLNIMCGELNFKVPQGLLLSCPDVWVGELSWLSSSLRFHLTIHLTISSDYKCIMNSFHSFTCNILNLLLHYISPIIFIFVCCYSQFSP